MLGTNCFAVISLRVGRYKVGLHWRPRKFHLCANHIQISDQIPFPLFDILSDKVALLAQLLVGLCCCGITFAHRSSAFQIASSFCSSTILMLIFGVAMGSAYEIASSICSSCSSWSGSPLAHCCTIFLCHLCDDQYITNGRDDLIGQLTN